MTKQKIENRRRMFARLSSLGFTRAEADQLRRISMTLTRWDERECGDSNSYGSYAIERDEKTEKPFSVFISHRDGRTTRTAIADRERGAERRLAAIVTARNAREPDDKAQGFHQSDPRGASLYIVLTADLDGGDITSLYTRGVAVCD